MKQRILLVDDDLAVLITLKAVLELSRFEVETAVSVAEALAKLKSRMYDLVITDSRMEREDAGFQVVRAAGRQAYRPATALLTAYPPEEGTWKQQGVQSLLVKPVGTEHLLRQIEGLLIRREEEAKRRPQPASHPASAALSLRRQSEPKAG